MKNASPALVALLNSSNTFIMADCYEVTLFNGTVYRWSTVDYPLTVESHIYSYPPDAPVVTRGPVREVVGLEVDKLKVTLGVGDDGFTIGGYQLPQLARNGLFDGAQVIVYRAFMSTPGTVVGSIVRFSGIVSTVTPEPTAVVLNVKSDLQLLQRKMPRNLFQPGCSHVLFDAGCALVRASFVVSGTVGSAATVVSIPTSLTQATDYFSQGVMIFSTGANTGARRSVKSFVHASGVVVPTIALPYAPANGDAFTIIPGCDKRQTTCETKFSNLAHFRGFPYIPKPEAAR